MKGKFGVFLLILSLLLVWVDLCSAKVDWEVWRTFKLNQKPLDMARADRRLSDRNERPAVQDHQPA